VDFAAVRDNGGDGLDNQNYLSHAKLWSNHHHPNNNTWLFTDWDAIPVNQPTVSRHSVQII